MYVLIYIYIYQGLTRQSPGPSKLLQYHSRQPPQTPAKHLQDPIPRQPQGPIQAQDALSLSLSLAVKGVVMVVMVVASRQSQDHPKQRASLHVECPYCILKLLLFPQVGVVRGGKGFNFSIPSLGAGGNSLGDGGYSLGLNPKP